MMKNNFKLFKNFCLYNKKSVKTKIYNGKNEIYSIIKNNRDIAIKKIHNNLYNPNEYLILSKLDNKSIIKVYNKFNINNYNYIEMEYYKEGDLHTYLLQNINNLSESDLINIFKKIIEPVRYCHNNNVVHLDIKLENFLINKDNIILCDFGFARFCNGSYYYENKISNVQGTFSYLSPELYFDKYFSKATDIWSMGILLYIMLNRKLPIENNINILYNDKPKFNSNYSLELNELLADLLEINHKNRPTVYDLSNYSILK